MSQTPPEPKQKKTGYSWLWIALALLAAVPLMMVMGLISLYLLRAQALPNYAAAANQRALEIRLQQEMDQARVSTPTVQVVPQMGAESRKPAQLLRVEVDFEDFETRTANAISVDHDQTSARLMVPSEIFKPMSGKINGRIVTRQAKNLRIVEIVDRFSAPGMGGGPMSASGLTVLRVIPSLGLTELSWSMGGLSSIRVAGDFKYASIGERLTVASLPADNPFSAEVTVLATDDSVQLSDGSTLDHLLKLTECSGPNGSLVCNRSGDPIAQIVVTKPGKLPFSYAVPMNRIFQAVYEEGALEGQEQSQLSKPVGSPNAIEPFPAMPGVGSLGEPPSLSPIGAGPPLPSAETTPRLEDPLIPIDSPFVAAPAPVPADAMVPDLSPERETQAYHVIGFTRDVADTIRSLYGDIAKIGVDGASQSIIVIAPAAVQEKIGTTVKEMNLRTQNLRDEVAKRSALEKERLNEEAEKSRIRLDAELESRAAEEAMEDEKHRKNPKRTRFIRVAGRDPKEVVRILTTLFGEKADVALDERTGSVLITINRATTWSEVQFLLGEIEGTAARLQQETPSDAAMLPSMPSGPMMGGATLSETPQRHQLHSDQDREARQIALQLRAAKPADQSALRAKLEQLTELQFLARQELRKKEIDELGNRIDQLRVTQLRRQQNQAEIIRRRVEELLDPNNDLRWEQAHSSTDAAAEKLVPIASTEALDLKKSEAPISTTEEQTFDGIAYSQWLKMLETERKPAKQAAAIEACSRLAFNSDVRRIADLIMATANLRSWVGNTDNEVWKQADAALLRMPREIVLDEVAATLRDAEGTKSGRDYQCHFLVSQIPRFRKELVSREQALVAQLVRAAGENGEDHERLLATACLLWMHSDRGIAEFEGLKPLVMQSVTDRPAETTVGEDWYLIAKVLIAKNPETPDLALTLLSYSDRPGQFERVLELVGQLGKHGQPAVPNLIKRFLEEWKRLDEIVKNDPNDSPQFRNQRAESQGRAATIVRVLGNIGVGDETAILLKELNMIAGAHSSYWSQILDEAKIALRNFPRIPETVASPILDDNSLKCGMWQIRAVNTKPQPDFRAQITSDNKFRWFHVSDDDRFDYIATGIDNQLTGESLTLDPTKSPREGRFRLSRDSQRNAVYELTDSTFKIYVAPVNQPAPTEMHKEGTPIPEGYSLIELRRSLSMPTNP